MSLAVSLNAEFIDAMYRRWVDDPRSVPSEWSSFFVGFEMGARGVLEGVGRLAYQKSADDLVYRFRDLGHLMACLDPLSVCPTSHPLLDLDAFGLSPADLGVAVYAPEITGSQTLSTIQDILEVLRETYCRSIGIEYMHLQDPEEREWLRACMEPTRNRPDLKPGERARLLGQLCRATRLEEFLHKRYLGQTRFSLEGAEALLPLLDFLLQSAARLGADQAVLGMAHRGRLNVQTNLLGKSYHSVFCQFEASYDPDALPGGGDVKYHSGFVGSLGWEDGLRVRVVLPENPSHLEAVNPVVEGIARALQDRSEGDGAARVLPVLVHGDAAFPGQGIVAETLNLSQLEGYATGGTVHVVLNNQIGYTTLPEDARSTRYATDPAKMLMVPVFHVHGENPEAVVHVARLAVEYRARFEKDVVIDLVCYRRHGHNEGDEPYFTQPLMYQQIRGRPALYRAYGDRLVEEGAVARGEVDALQQEVDAQLEAEFERARSDACVWELPGRWDGWEAVGTRYQDEEVVTGWDREGLLELMQALTRVPEGFRVHPTIRKILQRRALEFTEGRGTDWAGAEALAIGSLLAEGIPVRLSGEDSPRGTFSQRHCVWFDTETGATHVPLNGIRPGQAAFEALESPLSEAAVVGFEYGYAAVHPECLVLWEAQYGDFANGAQVIVDQFLASGEAKWQRSNGLVLLLPHGYEGQGPDHSTSRVERFLQLCAEENLQVCQPTTPAQYFHLLRRQVKRSFRKPLIVLTPKSLLRHPEVVSAAEELADGRFQEVLGDPEPAAVPPCRVLLCSGKVYYDLVAARRAELSTEVAILRLEQFYPFPAERLRSLAQGFGAGPEWVWVQEEPQNMGGWTFVAPRLAEVLERPARYVGRPAAASPATGFPYIHRNEQEELVRAALQAPAAG